MVDCFGTAQRAGGRSRTQNARAAIRLVSAILLEQDDEWAVADRRYFSAESMKQLALPSLAAPAQDLLAAIV